MQNDNRPFRRPGTRRTPAAWCVLSVIWWCAAGRATAAQEPGAPQMSPSSSTVPAARSTASPVPGNTLWLSIRTFGSLEHDTATDPTSSAAAGVRTAPSSAGSQLEVSGAHRGNRQSYELQGGSQFRGDQEHGGLAVDNQWLGATIRALATRRTTLSASQRVAYTPLYSPGSVGGATAGSEPARGSASLSSLAVTSTAGVSTQISRATSAALEYRFDRVSFSSVGSAVATHRASADVTRAIGRSLSLKLRYGYLWSVNAVHGERTSLPAHDGEVGLTYVPTSSAKATVSVGLTPNWTARPAQVSRSTTVAELAGGGLVKVGGFSKVDYALSGTWRAGLGLQRTLYFLPGYNQPVLADAFAGRVAGSLHRRLTGTLSAAYSRGTPGSERSLERVTSASASARLDFRTSKSAALYAEYLGDAYDLSEDIPLLPGLERHSRRSAVRVGMTIDFGLTARSRAARQEN